MYVSGNTEYTVSGTYPIGGMLYQGEGFPTRPVITIKKEALN